MNIHLEDKESQGDILAFLPGSEEIDYVSSLLNERIAQLNDSDRAYQTQHNYNQKSLKRGHSSSSIYENIYVLPLYANLPTQSQLLVFRPTPKNMRKVILATNIAETSLTIEGVKYVVDSGFVKLQYYDFVNNIDMLLTVPVSRASANQRAGRCGRTQSGKCYRLQTEKDYNNESIISQYTLPEMQRVDVTWSLLQLKALGVNACIYCMSLYFELYYN